MYIIVLSKLRRNFLQSCSKEKVLGKFQATDPFFKDEDVEGSERDKIQGKWEDFE